MSTNDDLANKYRPTKITEVYGNTEVVNQIKSQVKNGKFPHTSMFTGPSGCGKTTIARIVATKLGAKSTDLVEINGANDNGISTVRDISQQMGLAPLGKVRAFIFDECHQMSKQAQEGALKLLEEAKNNTYFFLCTTEPEKMITTVMNRAQQYEVRSLSEDLATQLLLDVAKKEGIDLEEGDEELIEALLDCSEGSPRRLLNNLQRIAEVEDMDDRLNLLVPPKAKKQAFDLCKIMMAGSPNKWKEAAAILKEIDQPAEQLRHMMCSYMEKVMLGGGKNAGRAYIVLEVFLADTCYFMGRRMLSKMCYEALFEVHARGED